jgi:hypothetical protein
MTHDNQGNLLIPDPIYKAKMKWRKSRKITLTIHQAKTISALLENYRLSLKHDDGDTDWVLDAENWIDVQLYGQIKIDGKWVKA